MMKKRNGRIMRARIIGTVALLLTAGVGRFGVILTNFERASVTDAGLLVNGSLNKGVLTE
jgi:hypothetical protein